MPRQIVMGGLLAVEARRPPADRNNFRRSLGQNPSLRSIQSPNPETAPLRLLPESGSLVYRLRASAVWRRSRQKLLNFSPLCKIRPHREFRARRSGGTRYLSTPRNALVLGGGSLVADFDRLGGEGATEFGSSLVQARGGLVIGVGAGEWVQEFEGNSRFQELLSGGERFEFLVRVIMTL